MPAIRWMRAPVTLKGGPAPFAFDLIPDLWGVVASFLAPADLGALACTIKGLPGKVVAKARRRTLVQLYRLLLCFTCFQTEVMVDNTIRSAMELEFPLTAERERELIPLMRRYIDLWGRHPVMYGNSPLANLAFACLKPVGVEMRGTSNSQERSFVENVDYQKTYDRIHQQALHAYYNRFTMPHNWHPEKPWSTRNVVGWMASYDVNVAEVKEANRLRLLAAFRRGGNDHSEAGIERARLRR